jgi:hypothetical protein
MHSSLHAVCLSKQVQNAPRPPVRGSLRAGTNDRATVLGLEATRTHLGLDLQAGFRSHVSCRKKNGTGAANRSSGCCIALAPADERRYVGRIRARKLMSMHLLIRRG